VIPATGAGLLHPFGDVDRFATNLVEVLESPRYRENAARHRPEFLERYDWRRIASDTERIYERAIAASS
jgi:glycosyltransferase involved in cell wall biosynthesis